MELDTATKEKIAAIQNTLKQTNALKASWVLPANFHLTMKFLGDTAKNKLPAIIDALGQCAAQTPTIDCAITAVACFPNERTARVVWVGIERGKEQLAELSTKIENALAALGFQKEKREFKSHITIARIKQLLDRNQLLTTLTQLNKTFSPLEFSATRLVLFESTLSPQGSIYKELFCGTLEYAG